MDKDKNIAIRVDNVSKIYRLYNKPSDRLKEALGFTKEKKYREHKALDQVSFDVHRGETVGIIGTNGSGKSTVLKIITGVLQPTMGNDGERQNLRSSGAGSRFQHGVYWRGKRLPQRYDAGLHGGGN